MAATVAITADTAHDVLTPDTLREALAELHGIKPHATEAILSQETLEIGEIFPVATGTPPKAGKDGFITLNVKTKAAYLKEHQEEQVDYREANKREEIHKGQVLLTIHDPTPGTDGVDVKGTPIPAKKGQPAKYQLGDNVTQKGNDVIATTVGVFIERGTQYSVAPILEINGDVDMSVGNINFTGAVIIKGNIPDGFKVESSERIEVKGVVGKSSLICGGDVILKGINGKGEGSVEADGDIEAGFLTQANIRAKGNIIVSKEISQSNVSALGEIHIEKGTIVGGETIALKGLFAGHLGSELGVPTHIHVGVDFILHGLETQRSALSESLRHGFSEVSEFIQTPAKIQHASDLAKSNIRKQFRAFDALYQTFFAVESDYQARRNAAKDMQPTCQIAKTVHPDTQIRSTYCKKVVQEGLEGPLEFIEDKDRSTFRIETPR